MIALLVITDGRRDCIERTIPSADQNLQGDITTRLIYDDSGDPENAQWLSDRFPHFVVRQHPEGRQGFGGAIRAAWSMLAETTEPFVFHLEDDFTFNRPVDLEAVARLLRSDISLAQVALRRQPWNAEERAAGGIVESHPDDFDEHTSHCGQYLTHRRFFTTNPCLYRRSIMFEGWPEGANSEGHFTHQLLASGYRFAYWGSRDSGEAVTHIGDERAGTGY